MIHYSILLLPSSISFFIMDWLFVIHAILTILIWYVSYRVGLNMGGYEIEQLHGCIAILQHILRKKDEELKEFKESCTCKTERKE